MADLSDVLHGLEVRAPWISAGRKILKRADFTIARGYANTIRVALAAKEDPAQVAQLESSLVEHLVAGQKRIHLLKLQAGELKALTAWATAKRRTVNPLTDAYPGVAPDAELRTHSNAGIFSLGYANLDLGVAAMFTSSRFYTERVELGTSQLKPTVADGFERVIGYRRNYVQAYDAIWIPPTGTTAVICLDAPLNAPTDFCDAAYAALHQQIRSQLGRSPDPINLWPAIEKLYRSTEGKLVDYGFVVAGKQVNHHKARRNTGDLRKAIYDQAGSAAVGDDLDPFKIAVQWSLKDPGGSEEPSQPELLLPGVAGDVNRANASVTHAFLRDGLTSGDLSFVVSKLLAHI